MARGGHKTTASLARYSTIQIEGWKPGEITGRDGKRYRVEGYIDGYCPTGLCEAVCCHTSDIYEGSIGSGPCRYLTGDRLCELHARSPGLKPISCMVWPVRQLDVDSVNEKAERLGLKGRCQLRVVEVDDGDSR